MTHSNSFIFLFTLHSNLSFLTLGENYAEPLFLKGYMEQMENFLQLLQDITQPNGKALNSLATQHLLALTNFILQIKTYQVQCLEKPKYLITWQADWVGKK